MSGMELLAIEMGTGTAVPEPPWMTFMPASSNTPWPISARACCILLARLRRTAARRNCHGPPAKKPPRPRSAPRRGNSNPPPKTGVTASEARSTTPTSPAKSRPAACAASFWLASTSRDGPAKSAPPSSPNCAPHRARSLVPPTPEIRGQGPADRGQRSNFALVRRAKIKQAVDWLFCPLAPGPWPLMNAESIRKLFDEVRKGKLSPDEAVGRLRHLPFEDLG